MEKLNNGVRLTWLGHATWLVESPSGKRILIDPWLDGNPACPEAYHLANIGHLDLILCTHGHGDHIGSLIPVAQQSGAPVVAMYDLTSWAAGKGVENTLGGNKGGTISVAGLNVTFVNALHSSTFVDNGVLLPLGDPCGFIIEFENGYKVYEAGDTDVFGDMALIAELYAPDLAILPIGDRFTMGPKQAAKAIELLGVKRVLPQHYATFPPLTGTPEALQALVGSEVEIIALKPGETLS